MRSSERWPAYDSTIACSHPCLTRARRVFFCKYNDPIYVKMAKLEIIYRLANERNVEQVLAELREYATEVDVDFVQKSVRSIGRLALKISSFADRCVDVLLSLIGEAETHDRK